MRFITESPELSALVFLLVGILVARWLSSQVVVVVRWIEGAMQRVLPGESSYRVSDLHRGAIRQGSFYVLLAVVLLFAVRILGVDAFSIWLDGVLVYLPNLIMGLLLILLGYLLSVAARNLVQRVIPLGDRSVLPRVAQGAVILIAIITGLEQMRLDISFLDNLVMVVLAGLLLGLSIAFAMGARQLVTNLLSARELARYRIGDRIRIMERVGTIQEIHQTGVVLRTPEGQINVPSYLFAENPVTLLDSESTA